MPKDVLHKSMTAKSGKKCKTKLFGTERKEDVNYRLFIGIWQVLLKNVGWLSIVKCTVQVFIPAETVLLGNILKLM